MTEIVIAKIAGKTALVSAFSGTYFALTDAVAVSIVTNASAVLLAGISAYFSYKAKVMAEAAKAVAEQTGKAVDGHLTEFKTMAKKTFMAEGVLQEKTDEKVRQADAKVAHDAGVTEEKEKAAEVIRKIENE